MIEYINKRLNDWARWRVSDRAMLRHMLGVKSCWPDMKRDDADQKYERHGTVVPFDDLECCDTDKAVCALPPPLKETVIEYYTRVGTAETTARRLGVSKMTLFRRIDQAHIQIMGSLNDLSAGIRLAPGPTLPEKSFDFSCYRSA